MDVKKFDWYKSSANRNLPDNMYISANLCAWTYLQCHFFLTALWCHKTQIGRASVGNLYGEPMGGILTMFIKLIKHPCEVHLYVQYNWIHICTHQRFSVCFPVRSHFSSQQNSCYLTIPCPKHYDQQYFSTLPTEVSIASPPTLSLQFC